MLLLGRVGIASAILYHSAAYILFTDNSVQSLVVNSVATVFILNIDSCVNSVMICSSLKTMMTQLPPIGVPAHSMTSFDIYYNNFIPWISLTVSVALAYSLTNGWCNPSTSVS